MIKGAVLFAIGALALAMLAPFDLPGPAAPAPVQPADEPPPRSPSARPRISRNVASG